METCQAGSLSQAIGALMTLLRKLKFKGSIVAYALVSAARSVAAGEIELFLPDSNVSSKPILEFRARPPTLKPPSAGHAFVFLGREIDNGNTIFSRAGGFYPEND